MAFTPEKDLNAVQRILIEDATVLSIMDLTGKPPIDLASGIIKRSKWDDLASSNKRICISLVPDRNTRNESINEMLIQIDVHVPAIEDYKAWRLQERFKKLLNNKRINNSYFKFYKQLGETPTMAGFFCCSSRFRYYKTI